VLCGTTFSLFDGSPRSIGIGANVDALKAYKNINSNKEHQRGIQTTFLNFQNLNSISKQTS
jgi:hypothetical protein